MDNFETNKLNSMVIAPYIQVATALIGKTRKIGGNQFRHNWSTLGILIDHKIIDAPILKASVIHDLKEDAPESYYPGQIKLIDADGNKVVELVEELSIGIDETKAMYLERVIQRGTEEAKIIKLADRISNLIDIQLGIFDVYKIRQTLDETEKYILPFAKNINENMYLEMSDLITSRTRYVKRTIELIANGVIDRLKDIIRKDLNMAFIKIESDMNLESIVRNVYSNIYD
ncbi:MAG: hypothetical protein FWG85_04115 [Bacteroidetes bacterium]|nr:hypothetical protein [Bacteroidota bacterium]